MTALLTCEAPTPICLRKERSTVFIGSEKIKHLSAFDARNFNTKHTKITTIANKS